MSGAGRGTPRISPSSVLDIFDEGAIPSRAAPFSVNDAKFVARIRNNPENEQVLTTGFELYIPANPVPFPEVAADGTWRFPSGVVRGNLTLRYSAQGPGSYLDVQLAFPDVRNLLTQYGTTTLDSPYQVAEMRPLLYRVANTSTLPGNGFVTFPFVFPIAFTPAVMIYVRESGTISSAGSVAVLDVFADNLAENSLLPTITD